MSKLKQLLIQMKEYRFLKYVYYNHFCKSVVRHGKGKLLPYKNAVIDIAKGAVINVYDEDIHIGVNQLRGSKEETRIRLREDAVWEAKGRALVSYGSTIELQKKALFSTEYFTMNSFSVLITNKEITLGDDVMIARNVYIIDSDYHAVKGKEVSVAPVHIGKHVWLASNVMILNGVTIGENAIVAANTQITEDVAAETMVGGTNTQIVWRENTNWNR